jgi:hypothetical protein
VKPERPSAESDEDLAQLLTGRGPCTFLLLSLLALVLIYPYLEDTVASRIVLGFLYSCVLIAAVYVVGRQRRAFALAVILALVSVGLQWSYLATAHIWLHRFTAVSYMVFLAFTITGILAYILRRGPITADKLHGALAAYIMLAFLWAFLYALIESLAAGSFTLEGAHITTNDAFFRLLYFSFTTLTTTGYGDIMPLTDKARSVALIQQLAGVFYVAVLIARLAGFYPSAGR